MRVLRVKSPATSRHCSTKHADCPCLYKSQLSPFCWCQAFKRTLLLDKTNKPKRLEECKKAECPDEVCLCHKMHA